MGAGKTTIGRRIAEIKGMAFVDSDAEIEKRTGVDISFIFDMEGEEGFRKRETDVIAELSELTNTVLATGGGTALSIVPKVGLHTSAGVRTLRPLRAFLAVFAAVLAATAATATAATAAIWRSTTIAAHARASYVYTPRT